MTVGRPVTRTDADQAIGIMVQSYPDSGEATLAGNMIADAQQSLQIFRGQSALAAAKNFRTNMKRGLGTGLY